MRMREQQADAADVVDQPRQVAAERVSKNAERQHPDDAADRVVQRERAQRHTRDAGEDADEAAQERDESAEAPPSSLRAASKNWCVLASRTSFSPIHLPCFVERPRARRELRASIRRVRRGSFRRSRR